METPLSAKLAILGFALLLVGLLFLYHYLDDRARRRKEAAKGQPGAKSG